jgi:hypothetical protein
LDFFSSPSTGQPIFPTLTNQPHRTPLTRRFFLLPLPNTNQATPFFSFTAASTAPARQDRAGRPLTRPLLPQPFPFGCSFSLKPATRRSHSIVPLHRQKSSACLNAGHRRKRGERSRSLRWSLHLA